MDDKILRKNISENLARLRKAHKMTQFELAEKINYSDKSISKWERGDGIPDTYVLCNIAELFGVSVNDIIYSNEIAVTSAPEPDYISKTKNKKHMLVTMMSIALAWLVALIAFTVVRICANELDSTWLLFVGCIPVSFVLLTIFSKLWFSPAVLFGSVSGLSWSLALLLHLLLFVLSGGAFKSAYLIYIIAGVFQILVVLWFWLNNGDVLLHKKKK